MGCCPMCALLALQGLTGVACFLACRARVMSSRETLRARCTLERVFVALRRLGERMFDRGPTFCFGPQRQGGRENPLSKKSVPELSVTPQPNPLHIADWCLCNITFGSQKSRGLYKRRLCNMYNLSNISYKNREE